MLLAEWSGEAPVEYQQNIRSSMEIGQSNRFTPEVLQGEIGSWGV
jgi:hypothetical protein